MRPLGRREHRVTGLPAAISHSTDAVSAGGLLFVSGMVSVDASGALLGEYLTDVDDRTRINPVRREFLGETLPASTLVEVSRLAAPGATVETECVAALPDA